MFSLVVIDTNSSKSTKRIIYNSKMYLQVISNKFSQEWLVILVPIFLCLGFCNRWMEGKTSISMIIKARNNIFRIYSVIIVYYKTTMSMYSIDKLNNNSI